MKNGLKFLEQLKENNNREWFANHKPEFDLIVKENKVFFNQIYAELQKHDSLNEIHIFRIYKDVRFSKDKSPYKTNLGAGYSRTKPHLRGGYYLYCRCGSFPPITHMATPYEEKLKYHKTQV